MRVVRTVEGLKEERRNLNDKKKIGFVPTMGALHKGHISLVEKSVSETDFTIVSIFVNPRQFNEKSDFENYPTEHKADLRKLENCGCDLVFMPNSDDVYQDYSGFKMDFDGLDKIYEGEFRPGHFQGVVDVVYRLFDLVDADIAYFGKKDFQQLAVIKKMVKKAGLSLQIIGCDIVREDTGLAMSSRNERLDVENRLRAASIYKLMKEIARSIKVGENTQIYKEQFLNDISKVKDMKPEYCVFCDPDSLEEIINIEENSHVVMCVAVWCTNVRLIDNIILEF